MKNVISKKFNLTGFYQAMVLVLSFVLMISANSTTCHIIHQPEEPEEIGRFKCIK